MIILLHCFSFNFSFLQYIDNCPNESEIVTTNVPLKNSRGNTEYRLKFAWPRSKNATDTQEELKPAGGGSRRSAFMATVGHEKPLVPVHKKRINDMKKREGTFNNILLKICPDVCTMCLTGPITW